MRRSWVRVLLLLCHAFDFIIMLPPPPLLLLLFLLSPFLLNLLLYLSLLYYFLYSLFYFFSNSFSLYVFRISYFTTPVFASYNTFLIQTYCNYFTHYGSLFSYKLCFLFRLPTFYIVLPCLSYIYMIILQTPILHLPLSTQVLNGYR